MNNTANRDQQLMTMTSDIVAAHVANNNVAVSDLPKLIENVHGSLRGLTDKPAPKEHQNPAVPIKYSITSDLITCLDCGKSMKMLKRHLMANHQMTPSEYRKKWELAPDYPMVTSRYSKIRSGLAIDMGLGRKSS